ncbi:gamma-glutamyltransferase [Pseudoroseomonas deserti]|uniref:Glutathione hydrolase proenzyme n=1 Tax=Teichococcus deserti TaxID=1817963 RepID=A0A1V2GYW7_9PROT|nr:gamma-glutamyltransferase [Pseudoroseomonas deserti]ONG50106.1 gamma-glutamyltransferase [Pseudoroseomonas deserti]
MNPHRRAWRPLIMGRRAAIATNHPEATAAGMAMLRQGGNAADAAAAISLALGVAEPHMSGLGGDGFSTVFIAGDSGPGYCYNGSGAAPAAATADRFPEGMADAGPGAVSTPGCLAGIHAMQRAHGKLPWSAVVQPAIALARDGFAATHSLRRFAQAALGRIRADANTAATFLRDGAVPAVGTLITQPRLAATLEAIAEGGADAFYRGALAARLAEDLAAVGAISTAADLAATEGEATAPISITYRGYEVRQSPPNSMGFVLLQELKIVERFDLSKMAEGSAELLHILVEAKKLAFLDRERHASDPKAHPLPLDRLLSDGYAASQAAQIDPARAASIPLRHEMPNDGNTTYFCVVDEEGNAVSAIQSLNSPFGSGVQAPGTGILLNNRMTTWHLDPTHPNALVPGKRVRHTMNAPMILKDGKVWAVLGTPGADNQVQINLQTVVSLVDLGLDPQLVAEAPRWSSSQPGQEANWPHGGNEALTLEGGFPAETVEGLKARGHAIKFVPPLEGPCSIECIRVLENGVRMAGSDPRRDGWAAAY